MSQFWLTLFCGVGYFTLQCLTRLPNTKITVGARQQRHPMPKSVRQRNAINMAQYISKTSQAK
jgi:hypothetical protein